MQCADGNIALFRELKVLCIKKIHNTEEIMHFNDIINAVLNGLAEFRFQDFIDIVIITVIIYKIICWTVNTRAYQLLKGLAVLLVVMLLSALFNLYTVNYLLNTLLVSGIVVMVVLFQPELRRALAHIGRFNSTFPDVKLKIQMSSLKK